MKGEAASDSPGFNCAGAAGRFVAEKAGHQTNLLTSCPTKASEISYGISCQKRVHPMPSRPPAECRSLKEVACISMILHGAYRPIFSVLLIPPGSRVSRITSSSRGQRRRKRLSDDMRSISVLSFHWTAHIPPEMGLRLFRPARSALTGITQGLPIYQVRMEAATVVLSVSAIKTLSVVQGSDEND